VTKRLGFAHRGASAHARENTLAAFRLALEMGASGLETDVWLTADEVPVLHHGARIRRPGALRRRPIAALRAAELPTWVPSLTDLYAACGTDLDLSLDLKDGRSALAVLEVARSAGHDPARLWLCGGVVGPLAWRELHREVRIVSGTAARDVAWTEHLARLRDGGVDAVNLRHGGWTAAGVEAVHDAGLLAFGWDAQSTRRIHGLLALGCDGVYSDHVDRMVAALRAFPG
jgi:glycerophosphoryl diester phosphodiesterase